MNDLLDDMNQDQMKQMMNWFWINKFPVTRANVKGWKKQNMK